jgi:ribosomal-protein-alanine N-acetyltransferase
MKIITQFNSIESFATKRLLTKKLAIHDLDKLILLDTNPQVMATLNGVRTQDQTEKGMHFNLKHWEENGFGAWMVYSKTTNEWVGRCALRHVLVDGHEEIEIAYALLPKFWNLGFATEMVKACVEVAFEVLKLNNVVCFTLTTNKASQRVMEKAGFHYEHNILHFDLPHVLYRIKI